MVRITSRRIEIPLHKTIVNRPDGIYVYPKKVSPLVTTTNKTYEDYALVQEGDEANCAISMFQMFGGEDWLNTNIKVLNSGLTVPRTSRFITHLRNVNAALEGKGVLYKANGNLIEGLSLVEYTNRLNNNCRVYLNDSFKSGEGFLNLDVATIIGLDNNEPIFKNEPLERCLDKDCWADLESVNSQGFPTKKSPIEKYEPGKSVYFYYPQENRVARFDAGSDWASLYCGRNPANSYAALGVFACAEGASQKI